MNITTLIPSLAVFLGIIFTLADWSPKMNIGKFITRSLICSGKVFLLSVITLYVLMYLAKGI